MGEGGIEELAGREVTVRHAFFADLFAGRMADDVRDVVERNFDADFYRICPDGSVQDRNGLVAMLELARGSVQADFAIVVDFEDVRALAGEAVLVRYLERQSSSGSQTARRATALFERGEESPNGVIWRFVQETWIKDAGT